MHGELDSIMNGFRLPDLTALTDDEWDYAETLQREGMSEREIGEKIAWKRSIKMQVFVSQRVPVVEPDTIGEEMKAIRAERDSAQNALALASQKIERLQKQLKDIALKGKARTTALKAMWVLGNMLEYDPHHNNGATTRLLKRLRDDGIAVEDDDAFRNLFKEAFELKLGGHWDRLAD